MSTIGMQLMGAQGAQDLTLGDGARLRLKAGQSLVINQEGVRLERRGADLVIVLEGTQPGQAQQVVVEGFFSAELIAQVLVQEPGEAVRVVTPQSADVPAEATSNEAAPPPQSESHAGAVSAAIAGDLRIDDARGQLLAGQPVAPGEQGGALLVGSVPVMEAAVRTQAPLAKPATAAPPAPGAPTVELPALSLSYAGLPALNQAALAQSPVLRGTAEARSRLVLTLADARGSHTFSLEVDASGQWQLALSPAQWLALSGPVTVQARALNSVGVAGPASAAQSLYVDVAAPGAPQVSWPEAALTLDGGVTALGMKALQAARDGLDAGTFSGTAEAGAQITLLWQGTQGAWNATVQAGADGRWRWTPDAAEVADFVKAVGEGALELRAVATDALGNQGPASAPLPGWLDGTPPVAPSLALPPSPLTVSQLPVYNRSLLGQAFSGTAEAGSTVTLRLADARGKTAEFTTVATAEGWTRALTEQEWITAGLAEGPLALTAFSTDKAGNNSPLAATAQMHLDITAPAVPSLALPELGLLDGLPAYNRLALGRAFEGSAEAGSWVTLRIKDEQGDVHLLSTRADDQGRWQLRIDQAQWDAWMQGQGTLNEGVVELSVQARDAAGNVGGLSAVQLMRLDITPPVVTSIAPPAEAALVDGEYALNRQAVSQAPAFTGQAEAGSTVTLRISDASGAVVTARGTANASGQWRIAVTESQLLGLADGRLTVQASATDRIGNAGAPLVYEAAQPIVLHKTLPQPVTTLQLDTASDSSNGQPGTAGDRITSVAAPVLTGRASAGQTVILWLDRDGDGQLDADEAATRVLAQTNESGVFSALMRELPSVDGSYTFTAVTQDRWGNLSNWDANNAARPLSLTVRLDRQAFGLHLDPVAGDDRISDTELNTEGVTLTGAAEAGAQVVVEVWQDKVKKVSYAVPANSNGTWSVANFASNTTLTDGIIELRVSQTDAAGNTQQLPPRSIPVRVTPLGAVSNVRLDDSSNTNLKGDQVTADASPLITGTGPQGSGLQVAVWRAGVEVGRADLVQGLFSWRVPSPLADGSYQLTFKVLEPATGSVSAREERLSLTIDTQVSAPLIDPVVGDDFINAEDFAAGAFITGTAEAGATVSLVLRAGSIELVVAPTSITYIDTPGASTRQWRYEINTATANVLGDGLITVQASQRDLAGNDSAGLPAGAGQATRSFTLNRSALAAPSLLDLLPADDSGTSNADNVTALGQLRLSTRVAEAGLTVQVFDDIDGDGVYAAGTDTLLGQAISGAGGLTELTLDLAEGGYRLRAWAQDKQGRQSSTNAALTLTVDQTVEPVTALRVSGDDALNASDLVNGSTITGRGEPLARVHLRLYDAAGELLLTLDDVNVNSGGTWSASLSAAQLASLGADGRYILKAQQTDRAGNLSAEVSHEVLLDTQAPRAPQGSEWLAAEQANSTGPWSDAAGVTWGDLFVYNAEAAVYDERLITVHVALPTDAAQGGQLAQVDDMLRLAWGSLVPSQALTQTDLDRGYALVQLTGSQIDAAGVFSGLDVKAQLIDAVGNASPEFTVLSGIRVPLSARAPTLLLDDAQQNPANPSDITWYSNHSFLGAEGQRRQSFSGSAEPGTQVEVGYVDPTGAWQLLGRAVADPDTGQYTLNTAMPAAMTDGLYRLQARFSAGTSFSYSAASALQLDTTLPGAPTLDQTSDTVAGNGLVNASERNAVPLSGSAEPWAWVNLQLVNTSTGVAGSVLRVQADAAGRWSRTLGVVDWGQVGEGEIKLSVWQQDLAGNSSRQVDAGGQVVSLIYDAQAAAPRMDPVAGDDFINASEAAASGGVVLRGGGEPGALITVALSGSQGFFSRTFELGADSSWALNLSSVELAGLGQGTVSASLSQVDRAGNSSGTALQTFVIDTAAAPPTLDAGTAGDGIINASEKALGVRLGGTGEPGATVTLTLTDSQGQQRSVFAVVGTNGRYAAVLGASQLDGLADGQLTVSLQQTDRAGNTSAATAQTLTLRAKPLPQDVTVDTVGGDDRLSFTEQQSSLRLQGSAPAGTTVQLQLVGTKGSLSREVAGGLWSVELTPAELLSLGAGQLSVQAWAFDAAGNTTAITTRSVLLESAVAQPSLASVTPDGVVNALEAADTAGVALSGKGTPGHVVRLVLTGSSGRELSLSALVGSDGSWSASPLDAAAVQTLGEGRVAMRLWQKTSAQASDTDRNQASVDLSASFVIDTQAPVLLPPSAVAVIQAHAYNGSNSAARDGQVTLAEAQQGVVLAVPVRDDAGQLIVAQGDKVVVFWGGMRLELPVGPADLTSIGSGYLYYLTVPASVIAQEGSGLVQVRVAYLDAAGNLSADFTLLNSLAVVAPPAAPLLDAVGDAGYFNQARYQGLGSTGTLVVGGGTASADGSITLELSNGQVSRTYSNLVIGSSGTWQAPLTAADLDALGQGSISMRATFVRSADGARSPVAASSFVFDKTLPGVPTAQNQQRADEANAVSELAGGLIRMDGQITEAARTVQVRVALPANAAAGDRVTLLWGRPDATATGLVTTADLQAGYTVVAVPSALITAVGDSAALQVSACFTDAAGNQGVIRPVWTGQVDAVPAAPSVGALAFSAWLNLAESQDAGGWQIAGSSAPGARLQLTLTGASGQVLRRELQASGTYWAQVLSASDAQLLGDGRVSVSAVQFDATGNASSAATEVFRIDLTPPQAPVVQAPQAFLTYAQTQAVQTYQGSAEAGAQVRVRFARAGNVLEREAVADAAGAWQVQLASADFAALSANAASGPVSITATQTDTADNRSPDSAAQTFNFSAVAIAPPSFSAVTGLLLNGADRVINLADVDYTQGRPLVISGTASGGNLVKLALTVAGRPIGFEVAVGQDGRWSRSFTAQEFDAMGQGTASLAASTVQVSAEGQVLNESVASLFRAGGVASFSIDTVAPGFAATQVRGTGLGGNAKAGDFVEVVLLASEALSVSGAPSVLLTGFGDDGLGTRTAVYDAAASALLGVSRLVLRYQVQDGDLVRPGALQVAGTLTLSGGATVRDGAGNPAQLPLAAKAADAVQVDTAAPLAPQLGSVGGTAAGSPGQDWINLQEANATVAVQVSLAGTGAVAGDTLELLWVQRPNLADPSRDLVPAAPFTLVLSAAQVAAGSALVNVPASVVGLAEGWVAVRVRLLDQSGNASAYTADAVVRVDTLAPNSLAVDTWMGDDKVNEREAPAVQALTGRGAESGASVQARVVQGARTYELQPADITVGADGSWQLSAERLQALMGTLTDGSFRVDVRQLDARENAGPWLSTRYFKDTSAPNAPATPLVAQAQDGWINASDAQQLSITVSVAGTGAQVGDTVRLRGLAQTLSVVLTSADLAAGRITWTPSADQLLQAPGQAPLTGLQLQAEIEDQGGNVSPLSQPLTVGLDTNVLAPTVVRNALTDGVSGAEARQTLAFTGAGIEAGATVEIRITGVSGKTLLLVPSVAADGSYSASLAAGDFVTLGEGPASYSVVQTDRAGNLSTAATGGFSITLTTPPPVLEDFAGDNVVGANEWQSTQVLSGSGAAGATVNVDVFVASAAQPAFTRTATVGSNGLWQLNITASDFAALRTAAGSNSVNAYFKASATLDGSTSSEVTQAFKLSTSAPALAGGVTRFDANGDGANNDGLIFTLNEPVRVSELANLSSLVLPSGRSLGAGAQLVALDSTTLNGAQFASRFALTLGTGHNLQANDRIGLQAGKVQNDAGNMPSANLSWAVPSLAVPSVLSTGTPFEDARLNGEELSAGQRLNFVQGFSASEIAALQGGQMQVSYTPPGSSTPVRVDLQTVKTNGLSLDLNFATPFTLAEGASISAVVRLRFADGSTTDVTLTATGNEVDAPFNLINPDSSDTARSTYRLTWRGNTDLTNMASATVQSVNASAMRTPDGQTLDVDASGRATLTLRFDPSNAPTLTSSLASSSVNLSMPYTNNRGSSSIKYSAISATGVEYYADGKSIKSITFNGVPDTSLPADIATGVTTLQGTYFWAPLQGMPSGLTFPPEMTGVTTANMGNLQLLTHTSVVVPDSVIAGQDVNAGQLNVTWLRPDGTVVGAPNRPVTAFSLGGLNFSAAAPASVDYVMTQAEGLAALATSNRTLRLFMDGAVVGQKSLAPDTLVLTIPRNNLTYWAERADAAGNSAEWWWSNAVSRDMQYGQNAQATVRVSWRDNAGVARTRDITLTGPLGVLEASGSDFVMRYKLNDGFTANDFSWSRVTAVAPVSNTLASELIPPQNASIRFSMSVPVDASALPQEGTVNLSAQVVDTAGQTSVFSTPRSIKVDRAVAPLDSVTVVSDTGAQGAYNAGDVLELRFGEQVNLLSSALPAAWNVSASQVAAVGGVNGYSTTWRVTLGSGVSLSPRQELALREGFITDLADNTNAAQNFQMPTFGRPAAALIDNVSQDNVITTRAGEPVSVRLTGARAGDVLTLLLDGVQVGQATVAADGQASHSFADLPASAWGADGVRKLQVVTTRGDTSVASALREVYVQVDETHWSLLQPNTYWLDPNSIVQAHGSAVSQWTAVRGGRDGLPYVLTANNANNIRLMVDPETGQQSLVNNSVTMTGNGRFWRSETSQVLDSANPGGYTLLSVMYNPNTAVRSGGLTIEGVRYAQPSAAGTDTRRYYGVDWFDWQSSAYSMTAWSQASYVANRAGYVSYYQGSQSGTAAYINVASFGDYRRMFLDQTGQDASRWGNLNLNTYHYWAGWLTGLGVWGDIVTFDGTLSNQLRQEV